jgi:hypothetical protein
MISWTDIEATQERNKELRHRAEEERLIRQVRAGGQTPSLWQLVRSRMDGLKSIRKPGRAQANRVLVKRRTA